MTQPSCRELEAFDALSIEVNKLSDDGPGNTVHDTTMPVLNVCAALQRGSYADPLPSQMFEYLLKRNSDLYEILNFSS